MSGTLKTIILYFLPDVFVVSGRKANPVPVTPFWSEMEDLVIVYVNFISYYFTELFDCFEFYH